MSLLYMNARAKQLISILLSRNEFITLKELAGLMDVSRRTMYYDIKNIGIWLSQYGIKPLEMLRGKGVFIPYNEREKIRTCLESDRDEQVYIFSPKERYKGIICYVIYADEPIYVDQLIECFKVSRNTLFADLKSVAEELGKYGLALEYQPKTGYQIAGNPVTVRALFMLYFSELLTLFQMGVLPFFSYDKIQDYYNALKNIEERLDLNYVEGVIFSLAALVPLLYRHRKPVIISGLKAEEMMKTKEFKLVGEYFPHMLMEERLYLTLHLLGSRVNALPAQFVENPSKSYIHDLCNDMIGDFEKTACVVFDDRSKLEKALFVHLSTSLYRYEYGIQIGNPLGEDVIKEYPELFAITKKVAKKLEIHIGKPILDSEIAYLALHFGSFLKISNRDAKRLRILIVCVNGISTGNMIKREVQKLLPFAEIVDVRANAGLQNIQDICDVIISSVPVNTLVPNIMVHPILSEQDRKNILNHRLVAPRHMEIQKNQIFQVVKKYVPIDMHESLKNDLTAYLQGDLQELQIEDKMELGLCKLLDESRIQIVSERCMWQESIRRIGKSLVDCRSITTSYIDHIIRQLQYYGPYMFLTENVIIAHAKPEDGVNTLDISLGIFREPVVYSELRKARLVFVLAAEDQEKHLRVLQDILAVISNEDTLDKLLQCQDAGDALRLIQQVL